MTRTMRAVRVERWGEPARMREVPVPTPEPGGVLLRVTAAGMCHSDLHVMDAPPGHMPFDLPFTLGHEVAGTVVGVGDGVEDSWIGRDVVVYGVWGCGSCRRCVAGRENYCLERSGAFGNGLGRDGGIAEYMAVPATRYLVPIDGLDPVQAAPLADAGLTAYHAIKPLLPTFGEGSRVLVIGAGGLGHYAVQLLAPTGATIVVVDPKEPARDLARSLGAHATFGDLEEVARVAVTASGRFDAIYDFVGADATMAAAVRLLSLGAVLHVVGGAGGVLDVGKNLGHPQGWTVTAPFWGARSDLVEVVEQARAGRLHGHVEEFPLSRALEAYDRLRAGEVRGRAVIVPDH